MKRVGLWLIVVAAVALSGCYLLTPAGGAQVNKVTVDPSYLTVGPGEQVTVNVTTDPPDAGGGVTWAIKDDYYAAVYGTSKVGLITGKHLGSTTLTATIGGKSSDVLCNVVPAGGIGSGAYITGSETVILMAPGDSRNVSAQLVGGSDQDQSGIQWQVKDASVLDILGQGPNALITALKNGTTQIVLGHPLSNTTFTISVRVDGSTKSLALSKNNFIMTPGDIQELEAAIADGSTTDMASIMWSVRAATGTDSNFLTVTGNGRMVSIIANSAGQGTVFAVFGAQIAQCDVIVQSNKKMAFQTGIVSGSPGDNFVVAYDYSPASLSIFWTISDAGVATYTNDPAAKKLNITLSKEGTATLRGTLSDGVTSDSLSITSKWDKTLTLSQSSINGTPSDAPTTLDFIVSPPGTPVSVNSDNPSVATASVNNVTHTITVTPHQEGQANISAQTAYVSESIACGYSYTSLGVNLNYAFSGSHSGLSGNTITTSNHGGSATITATPSAIGATGMAYTWSYQGDNDGGNLSAGTASENVFAFQNSGGWVLIGGHRQTGTLYLTVTHNGQNILSTSWEIDIEWH
jgi:hypothetical protein